MKTHILTALTLCLVALTGCRQEPPITPDEAREIAREAYVYGFPMVMGYKTMNAYCLDENSPEYKGPFNSLVCSARLYTPEDKAVVTPNADTPYCMAWADIRVEPVVITLPEVEPERFYHFQLIDLYTHNFAYLGTLTTGNGPGNYLIAGTDWKGQTPDGIDKVIICETGMFFIVVRTQLFGPEDMDNVKAIQEKYNLQPLRPFLGDEALEKQETVEFPEWVEGEQFTSEAFKYLDVMLKLSDPVKEETEMHRRFQRLGIGTEEGFDLAGFSPEVREAVEAGVKEGFESIEAFLSENSSDPLMSSRIFGTRRFLEQSAEGMQDADIYLLRAAAAHMGLYGNSGSEAIYPTYLKDAQGRPLDASAHGYTLTFGKDSLPPVNAFWSLTMYDAGSQLFIHNPLDRYLLNSSMMEDFDFGEDGSLTLYISKEPTAEAPESNWLPAPDGPFYCVMRLYGPGQEALEGTWTNPPMVAME